jgi:protein-S-isoprenylcysteine O-methyltransferase Ste14
MENTNPDNHNSNPLHIYRVHRILAHSYTVYFLMFLLGVVLNLVFNYKIFNGRVSVVAGFALLVFATFLIFWAQHTSRNLNVENISKETFCRGPYCYTRSPTHWGLFFLMLGFGFIANSFFIVLCTILALVLTKITFLKKEEKMLAEKYGSPYLEYKKSVKW